jgi:hypothetical protein
LSNVSWNEPDASSASLLISQLDTSHILMLVEDIDSSAQTIKWVGAPGWTDSGVLTQYPCAEAIDFDSSDFSANPYFSVGPKDFSLNIAGFDVPVQSLLVEGSFDSTGNNLKNVHFEAFVQGDFTIELFNTAMTVCEAADMLGISCTACPADATMDCLELDADASSVPYKPNVALNPDIDPSIDPNCN